MDLAESSTKLLAFTSSPLKMVAENSVATTMLELTTAKNKEILLLSWSLNIKVSFLSNCPMNSSSSSAPTTVSMDTDKISMWELTPTRKIETCGKLKDSISEERYLLRKYYNEGNEIFVQWLKIFSAKTMHIPIMFHIKYFQ